MSLSDLPCPASERKRHAYGPIYAAPPRSGGRHLLSGFQSRSIRRESLRSFHSHRMEPHLELTARPLWPGCFKQTGFRPAAKAGLIPFCALKRSCSSTAPEKLFRSAREIPLHRHREEQQKRRMGPYTCLSRDLPSRLHWKGSENVERGHIYVSERLAQDRSEETYIWPLFMLQYAAAQDRS